MLLPQLYQLINVSVVVVDVITWNIENQFTTSADSDIYLENFQAYHPKIKSPHDGVMMIT